VSPSVSIVIPCFNDGRFLTDAIASIERARCESVREIIIVDDGSDDPATLEILKKLELDGATVLRQRNRGLGAARNFGVAAAQGPYILPLDSDNCLRQAYLVRGVELLGLSARMGVVYGDAEYFGERSGRWTVGKFDFLKLLLGNYIDACAIYRKELWHEIGGYDETMPYCGWEDWDFWLRAALKGWRFSYLNEISFDYRVRANSLVCEVNEHPGEMFEHIFSKRELTAVGQIRNELRRLHNIDQSFEYRVAKWLFRPLRVVREALRPDSPIRVRQRERELPETAGGGFR
jgi:GT2 family glycosyltransferase